VRPDIASIDASLRPSAATPGRAGGMGLLGALAWRNLWRNRQRTWLTAGSIAFAVMLIVVGFSLQGGAMMAMADNATRLLSGHVQIQNSAYAADPALRNLVPDATAVARAVAKVPGVVGVAPRAVGFALVSVGERSYGAQLMGVDAVAERSVSSLPDMLVAGHDVASPTDAVLGALMARNLGIGVGDGFVVLGGKLDGGVAALALRVAGIVETGSTDLDRALVRVQLTALQDEFGLGDRAHMIVLRLETFELAAARLPHIDAAIAPLATNAVALSWQQLMPEMSQTIQLKRAGSLVMFGLIALLVTFSVFNSFMMSVFERTREIGMLLAIGMRPGSIVGVLQVEAAWLALLGAGIGVALGAALMALVQHVGIPLGGMTGDLAQRYHMPARLFPALDVDTLIAAPLLMLCATQLAALIPALRIRRLEPVDALRVRA